MRILRATLCLVVATTVWLGSIHRVFDRTPEAVAAPLAAHQLTLWESAGELEVSIARLRATNPEWDLMARMFAVLAFADRALDAPAERARYVAAIDRILARTVADVEREGPTVFLLPYGRARRFIDPAQRSLFVDGELALMFAARELVAPDPAVRAQARAWAERAAAQLARAPELLGESYPDEVWMFCNTVALAAIRMTDADAGEPDRHRELIARWVSRARTLCDPATGLLPSRLTYGAEVVEGPEGSTLWIAATMLRIVDDEFARDQYARTRRELRGSFAGFGWAREWPAGEPRSDDIDSGPTIPIVGANAGSSGLALVAARSFDDADFAGELVTSLQLAGFPVEGGGRYAAGNQLSDAAIMYALGSGSLWRRAREAQR